VTDNERQSERSAQSPGPPTNELLDSPIPLELAETRATSFPCLSAIDRLGLSLEGLLRENDRMKLCPQVRVSLHGLAQGPLFALSELTIDPSVNVQSVDHSGAPCFK
jgi:hypothetical protein